MMLLIVFLLSFWPWGRKSSADQLLNIYNAFIYITAFVFLAFFSRQLLLHPTPEKSVSADHIYKTGLSVFSVLVFFFLVIKFYAPLGHLHRFAFLIILIPIVITSLGVGMLHVSTRKILKTGIIFIFFISILNSLVFINPRVTSGPISNIPIFQMYNRLNKGNDFVYWVGEKKDIWESCISPDDVLLVISDNANQHIRYHMPGFRRTVYMAHPCGPYMKDADTDLIPLQIKQQLENSYSNIRRKKLKGNYSVGIDYLEYFCDKIGITKIYAETPVPQKLLPDSWHLFKQTSWGTFYKVGAAEERLV